MHYHINIPGYKNVAQINIHVPKFTKAKNHSGGIAALVRENIVKGVSVYKPVSPSDSII